MQYTLSPHAEQELVRRGIPREALEEVLACPQQIVPGYRARTVFQSQLAFGDGKLFLVRAIVDQRLSPALVLTVYRTSKIAKYWQQP